MITSKYRDLREQYRKLRAEYNRQYNSPSRGYDEDAALTKMHELSVKMEAELDGINANYQETVDYSIERDQAIYLEEQHQIDRYRDQDL